MRYSKIIKHIVILPLFFLLFSEVFAEKLKIGDWVLDDRSVLKEAFTSNSSGSVFGYFCLAESCTFYLHSISSCEVGRKLPVLINCDAGSTYVTGACLKLGDKFYNVIADSDLITAISSGDEIGIAIPLRGGRFKVLRFSLNGAIDAVKKINDAWKSMPNSGGTFSDSVY